MRRELFSCTVAPDDDRTMAYLHGELDASNVDRPVHQLAPAANTGSHIVLSLSGLRFMGTAGLSALVDLKGRAARAEGSLRLTHHVPPSCAVCSLSPACMTASA